MALGPGRYEDVAERLLTDFTAEGVVILVCEGSRGSGSEVRGSIGALRTLAPILRSLADEIERDLGLAQN